MAQPAEKSKQPAKGGCSMCRQTPKHVIASRRERSPDRSAVQALRRHVGMPPYGVAIRIPHRGWRPRQPVPTSPVGAIAESPADPRPCPTNGPPGASAPTEQTNVPRRDEHCSSACPTCARVRQTGRRGRRPLRSKPTSPVGTSIARPFVRPAPVSDRRAAEGVGPYGANQRPSCHVP